MFVSVW